MAKVLDSNQIRKLDRPYSFPIYLVHLTLNWEYTGSTSTSVCTVGGRLIQSDGNDNYLTDSGGIREGDSFYVVGYENTYPIGTVQFINNWSFVVLSSVYRTGQQDGEYQAEWGGAFKFYRSLNLYFSDRNFDYYGTDYEDYLFDLSNIEQEIQNLGGYDNSSITLRFKNERFRNKNYLIEIFDDYPIEKQTVEIYKIYHDEGETYSTDVKTKIFKGMLGQPYDITDLEFKVDCHTMLFSKDKSLPLQIITQEDYPDADPDDIGKYRNIIYGDCKKVICPWTVAGWASTLVADITEDATGIEVSEAPPHFIQYVVIDDETIRLSSISDTDLTVLQRGYGGTTAVAHGKAAIIYEKLTQFEAEVAQHPVKYIGDVFVKRTSNDEWLKVISGYTAYTNTLGKAVIIFTDKVKYAQSINVTAEMTGNPDHYHGISIDYSQKECIPDGSSGTTTGHSKVIDGNESTWVGLGKDDAVQARFDTLPNLGPIVKQILYIYKNDTAMGGTVQCPINFPVGTIYEGIGWHRIIKTGGSWTNSIVVQGGPYGSQIGEIYKIVEFDPVDSKTDTADLNLDINLSGNSAANMVIGDIVAADVQGYEDADTVVGTNGHYYTCLVSHTASSATKPVTGASWSTYWVEYATSGGETWTTGKYYYGSGTFTGISHELIERPDHVRKHILCKLLEFDPTTDIGTSFSTVGTIYSTQIYGGYKLCFVLHEVAIEAMNLFKEIDLQTRSNMFESGGQFNLHFNSTTKPTSSLTFNRDNIKGLFNLGKTEVADIKNTFKAYFYRDYSRRGEVSEQYMKALELNNAYSVTQHGIQSEDIVFSCLPDSSTMAYDILDWICDEKSNIKKTVEFNAFWDADILENCDYFYIKSNFWNDKLFKVVRWQENPADNTISIKGLEYIYEPFIAMRTHHWHSVETCLINQISISYFNVLNASHVQTATSPTILSVRSFTISTTTHSQTATASIIGYNFSLTIQNCTISQTAEGEIPVETSLGLFFPEIIPFNIIHLESATSPTLVEH